MPRDVITAEDLVVTRGGERVLDGVTVSIPSNAKLLIQGESGAGKTTLFETLGLLDVPDSGTLEVDGVDVGDASRRQRSKLRRDAIGIVFQDFELVPELTARENARLPQDHHGDLDPAWLDTLFEELEIEDVADQYPGSLSGGEKQRVAIARALANRPRVVFADEPTGQLDPATSTRVLEVLLDTQRLSETALVVVSHDRQLADAFDKVYRLREGELQEADGVDDRESVR